MFTCCLCRFEVLLDDVAIRFQFRHGAVICLSCFERETESKKPMAASLSREARRTVEEAP